MSTAAIITENCLNLTKLPVNYDGYIQEIAYTVLQCLSKWPQVTTPNKN